MFSSSDLAAGPNGHDVDLWTPWRRGGGASARSMLLTLLGEFVLPTGGWAWTATVIEAMSTLGVEAATTRQALTRTAAAGLLVSERHGRRSRWRLTPAAVRLLIEETQRIYDFGRSGPEWDGRWLVVLTTVPETNRHLRYRLRARLGWYGMAPLAGGVWLSPWPDREGGVIAALDDLDLRAGAISFVGAPGGLGDIEARVAEIWNLDGLEAQYRTFIETAGEADPGDEREAFAVLLGLVHDWRHFPAADPGLPDRLLPHPWSGQAAARVFADCHLRWVAPARSWWADLSAAMEAVQGP
jgi:phenylacetic acid degradation operon negative regulatory protein